jgi:dTDP-4-dehydrorhamnose 3,5-epimerase
MIFQETPLKDLYIIELCSQKDERGYFARSFCKSEFMSIGFDKEFVQFNHSYNRIKGTIRGLHFQTPPFEETKLIRCVQGSVYDVAVDLRADSPTYLQFFGIELSDKNLISILIPEGFAHGFQTLEDHTSLIYHHTSFYTPNSESGIRYNDPSLNINWPLPAENISVKDLSYSTIKSLKN